MSDCILPQVVLGTNVILRTGCLVSFNWRQKRYVHLFQNRYQSILCEDYPYLLELTRYIHLNPLGAGILESLLELGMYS